jgi:hypothetical protein
MLVTSLRDGELSIGRAFFRLSGAMRDHIDVIASVLRPYPRFGELVRSGDSRKSSGIKLACGR